MLTVAPISPPEPLTANRHYNLQLTTCNLGPSHPGLPRATWMSPLRGSLIDRGRDRCCLPRGLFQTEVGALAEKLLLNIGGAYITRCDAEPGGERCGDSRGVARGHGDGHDAI
jgi:hypothetical protein